MSDDDTYYRIVNAASDSDSGGVFEEEQKALNLAAHLSEEYESEYQVNEIEDGEFSFGEITRGQLLYSMEMNA